MIGAVSTEDPLQTGAVSVGMVRENTPDGMEPIEQETPSPAISPPTLQVKLVVPPLRTRAGLAASETVGTFRQTPFTLI